MGDAYAGLIYGFTEELKVRLERHKDLLDGLDYATALRYGKDGAAAAVAPLVWAQVVGDRWDTSTTAEFLAVSRQALHDRVRRDTLLGVPGRGTTWFPTWQFDLTRRQVHPVVPEILQVFRDALGDRPDPLMVASWVQSPQSLLDGLSPLDWIGSDDRDADTVLTAARRTAQRLAA